MGLVYPRDVPVVLECIFGELLNEDFFLRRLGTRLELDLMINGAPELLTEDI